MPRVPRLEGRQVAPAVVREPMETAAQQPEAVAANVLGTLANVAQEARARQNAVRLNAAEVEARRLRTSILLDPKSGVLNRQRQAAFDAPEVAGREWDAGVSRILQGLAPDQREAFLARAGQIRAEIEDQTFRHVRREMDVVDKENTDALIGELSTQAIENADDESLVSQNLTRAEELLRERLARQNVTDRAVVDAELGKLRSGVRLAQIQALVSASRPDAGEVFERVKGEMQTQDRADAKALVEQGDLIVQSQRRADDLFVAFGPNDERAALAEARTQFEGKLRDAVVQRLEQRYADERRLQAQSRDELMTDALGIIEGGGTLSAAQRAEIARTYPQGLRSLDARARQVANGTAVDTSWPEYERLQAVFETGDLSAIRDLNLSASRHLLSDTDYKAFIDRRSNILRGAADRANRAMTPLAIDRQILIDLQEGEVVGKNVRTMGDLNDYPASNRVFTQTRLAVLQAIEAKQAAKPDGPLTGPEMMQAIRSVTDDLVVQRKWGGGKVIFPRAVAPDGVTEAAPRRERPVVPTATRPDLATRNAQLRAAGLTANQRLAVLQSEGYTDEDVPQATRP